MDGEKLLRPRSLCSWRTRDRQPWDLAPNNDDVEAGAVPFQLRFWMQELIFAHCPCLFRPCLSGNLLSRVDRLSLRGIAGCERAVLPILEIASNVLQRRAEQLRDAPPGARDPACTGGSERTPTDLSESQQDSFQTDRRNNEYAGEAVPFQPRFLLYENLSLPLSTPASLRHLADPFISQQQTARRWQTELFSWAPSGAPDPAGLAAESSNQLSFAKTFTSADTGFRPHHAESN